MRKSRKFISMPIISIEEGQQIGSVRTLVIDPEKKEIAALVIEQRGWFKDQKIIPYSKVHSVGGDAITVERNSNAEKQTNLPHIVKLIKDKYELVGSKIVTENGVILGYVDEYYVDLISGKITSLEISGRFLNSLFNGKASLDMDYVKTVGKEVIVAFEGAENQLRQIEAGLRESVKSIKESTTSLWESTVKKTKEITESINNSLEKKKGSNQEDIDEAVKDELTDVTEYRIPEELEIDGLDLEDVKADPNETAIRDEASNDSSSTNVIGDTTAVSAESSTVEVEPENPVKMEEVEIAELKVTETDVAKLKLVEDLDESADQELTKVK